MTRLCLGLSLQNPEEMNLNILWCYLQSICREQKCFMSGCGQLALLNPDIVSLEAVSTCWFIASL